MAVWNRVLAAMVKVHFTSLALDSLRYRGYREERGGGGIMNHFYFAHRTVNLQSFKVGRNF